MILIDNLIDFNWHFDKVNSLVHTAQKIKFSIKDFFSKYEEIINGKLHFLCCANGSKQIDKLIVFVKSSCQRDLCLASLGIVYQ